MGLHRACTQGRPAEVRRLIQDGRDVNAYNKSGWTPLQRAAYHGHVEVTRELIRGNADVHLKVRESGRSALHIAAYYIYQVCLKFVYLWMMFTLRMDEQAAREMVRAKADNYWKVKGSGRTALHIAAYYGHQTMVKLFLEINVNINEQDSEGRTALMLSVERGHSAVVAELVKAGADINLKDKKGMSAVLLAKSYDMVHQLVRDVDHLSRKDRSRILWHACDVGRLNMVRSVIEAGCDVDHIHKGQTPVMMATLRGHDNIVKELILSNCDVNLHSNVYYSDLASSLNMAKMLWPTAVVWMAFVVFLESVPSSEPKVPQLPIPSWVNPVTGSLAVLVSPLCVIAGVFLPLSLYMALLISLLFFARVAALIAAVAIVAGPECRALAFGMALVVPLVMCGPRSVMSTVFGTIAKAVAFMLCFFVLDYMALLLGVDVDYLVVSLLVIMILRQVFETPGKYNIQAILLPLWILSVILVSHIVGPTWPWLKHDFQMFITLDINCIMIELLVYKASKATALHYAAGYNTIKCGVYLVEAGGDVRAKNMYFLSPSHIGSNRLEHEVKQSLSFATKKVTLVIGDSEHGKSTLVAALARTSNILWKKAVNHFKKARDIRQRTAGIEAVQVSNQKYGEALFYDFAGQSQYHGPHQSFLEAMLSKPEVSVTLLLLVKATEEEDIITQQLYRWLQPLALMSAPSTPKVMVVGSFLDQVKSRKEASEKLLRCTQSVKTELPLDIQGPCLLDCRQPESRGIDQICSFLQEARPVNTGALSYNLHWVLVQVRKAFPLPALQLHEFQTWLQDNAPNLPRNLPSPEEVCQDLSVAGHTLLLPNKQDPSQSWLILDLPALLHNIYSTLFSGSQSKVNQFGLLHCSQLAELFPEMIPEVIQRVLKSLEFCIEIDPALLEEELLQLAMDKGRDGWLYFPALVSAQPSKVFPEDPDPEQYQWMCWQLRTVRKHFISAHLLQTIILRLAARHVFTHKLPLGVRKHCCRVWAKGICWKSTKGVDIAVQISDSNMVQVVGRSQAGSEILHQYTSAVVRDVIKTTTQLSPNLKATPYIIHPYTPTLWEEPKAAQPNSLYPVSSITRCTSNHDDYVLSLPPEDCDHPQRMSLLRLFGWSPSLSVVQDMNFAEALNSTGPSRDPLNPLLSAPTLDELNQLVVWRVAAQWYEVGVFLEVGASVLDSIQADSPHSVRQACRDMFREWLYQGPGTGEQPRVWQSVVEAVKETVGQNVAGEVERKIDNYSSQPTSVAETSLV